MSKTSADNVMKSAADKAREFYFYAWENRRHARATFFGTKLWEGLLMPWRPITRFYQWRSWMNEEALRFETGLMLFGLGHWMEIISQGPPSKANVHVIKGGLSK
jgi:hypothetical protein